MELMSERRLKDDSKSLRSCTVKKKTGCFNHRVVTLVTWLHNLVLEANCINNLRGLIPPLSLIQNAEKRRKQENWWSYAIRGNQTSQILLLVVPNYEAV